MRDWNAVRTRGKWEGVVARYLEARGVEVYLPVYQVRRAWSDRVKVMDAPLFGGYVFVRMEREERVAVLGAPGVAGIVGFGGQHAPIPDIQIANVRKLLASGLPASPSPWVKVGDKVRIVKGALEGMEGTLLKVRTRWRFVVMVDLLQKGVGVEVDSETVEKVQ